MLEEGSDKETGLGKERWGGEGENGKREKRGGYL